jgi:3-deoxy-D-manno-octulosonic-acid transferase
LLLPFYYVLVTLVYILALPFILFISFKKKYKLSLPSRFFLAHNKPFSNKDCIWFHACSLGEMNSLKHIIKELDELVNVSVITQTGYKAAQEIEKAEVRFLPYELFLPFWIKKQKVLVVLEAELWPLLFVVSKLKGTKTILLNARISDNSYNSYKRFSFFYKWIFSYIDKVFAQSQVDKERLMELGAKDVVVNGNIKTISTPCVSVAYKKPEKEVITIASSHEGEEELLLDVINLDKDKMLIVVPRHPERFAKVDDFLVQYTKKNALSYARLSEDKSFQADVVLCDSMGELINIYAITDITYLCGSFKDGIGGHNPLECAYFNNKIISGPFVFNQKPLFQLIKNIKVSSVEDLKDINYDLLEKSEILDKGEIDSLLEELR